MSLPRRLAEYEEHFRAAGLAHGLDPMLLAAICDRESLGGMALTPPGPGGTGDYGHGRGLMQIDDRSHGAWLASNDWKDPAVNIEKGAEILAEGFSCFHDIFASIAMYNAGPFAVMRVLSDITTPANPPRLIRELDGITTPSRPGGHGDYVSDVLQRAARFALTEPKPKPSPGKPGTGAPPMDTPLAAPPPSEPPTVIAPAPSPTGTAVLPQWLPRGAAAIVAIAAAIQPLLPSHSTVAGTVLTAIIALGAALGIASQGVRAPTQSLKE